MKLLQKFNRQYIQYAIAVLALAGTSIFLVLKVIVNEDTDEMLIHFAKQIESELTREGLTYADSKYWTERHRRISQRTRDYFRQQREEVVNGNN